MTHIDFWDLDRDRARLRATQFSCAVDLRFPMRGIQEVRYEGNAFPHIRPFQISPQPPTPSGGESLVHSYVRGHDLVATYAQTPQRTVRPQLYWRYLPGPHVSRGLEVIISVQSSLLASDPTMTTRSTLSAEEVLVGEAGSDDPLHKLDLSAETRPSISNPSLFLFRLADSATSYCEIMDPADVDSADLERVRDELQLTYQMFQTSLEKGVIRRARLRGFMLPRKDDEALASQCLQDMVESELPLTT